MLTAIATSWRARHDFVVAAILLPALVVAVTDDKA